MAIKDSTSFMSNLLGELEGEKVRRRFAEQLLPPDHGGRCCRS